jgi:tetratricopeptide (TPR) repeat protein
MKTQEAANHNRGLALAKRAFGLWESGNLQEAEALYSQALPLLAPTHHHTYLVRGEYASVLIALGRHPEAIRQYQDQLSAELQRDPSGQSNAVSVARYFLGETFLQTGAAEAALEAIAPSLACKGPAFHLLHIIRADALHSLGRQEEAAEAARAALAGSDSEDQRSRIQERLQHVLAAAGRQEDEPDDAQDTQR